jgi:hypothetical protein
VTDQTATRDAPPASPPDEDDDAVPISVRLGTVVPPEDPEDWTQPLTWVAAFGMVLGPIVALLWFWLAPPADSSNLTLGTYVLASALVLGGVITGVTQIGSVRVFAGTLGAALFGALVIVIIGAAMAGQRQVGTASPTLAHAFVAAVSGLAGALAASTIGPALVRLTSVARRVAVPAAMGVAVAAVVARLLAA